MAQTELRGIPGPYRLVDARGLHAHSEGSPATLSKQSSLGGHAIPGAARGLTLQGGRRLFLALRQKGNEANVRKGLPIPAQFELGSFLRARKTGVMLHGLRSRSRWPRNTPLLFAYPNQLTNCTIVESQLRIVQRRPLEGIDFVQDSAPI